MDGTKKKKRERAQARSKFENVQHHCQIKHECKENFKNIIITYSNIKIYILTEYILFIYSNKIGKLKLENDPLFFKNSTKHLLFFSVFFKD